MLHVVLLKGGPSIEQEVSNASASNILKVLSDSPWKVSLLEFNLDTIVQDLLDLKPDIVFIGMHGQYGEDGRIQGFLDIMRIPYTHSPLTTSAICMNKDLTKRIVSTLDIKSPKGLKIDATVSLRTLQEAFLNSFNGFVVKPLSGGSSVSTNFYQKLEDINLENIKNSDLNFIVEERIVGAEFTVLVLNGKALGCLEIQTKNDIFDHAAKFNKQLTEYLMPPITHPIGSPVYEKLKEYGEHIFKILGCQQMARMDFIVQDDEIFFLEVNTHPGFTSEHSMSAKIASYFNISEEALLVNLIQNAKYYA
jgi:D-alanine-D-alanine ligase